MSASIETGVSYSGILINYIGNALPGENIKQIVQLGFQLTSRETLKQTIVDVSNYALNATITSRPAVLLVKGLNKALDATEFLLDIIDPLDPPDKAHQEDLPFRDYLAIDDHNFTSTPKSALPQGHSPACRFLLWKFLISDEESRLRRVAVRCFALPLRLTFKFIGWLELKLSHQKSVNDKFTRPKLAAKKRLVWIQWMILRIMRKARLLKAQNGRFKTFNISDQVSPVQCSMKHKLVNSRSHTDNSDSGTDTLGGTSSEGDNSQFHGEVGRDKNITVVAGDVRHRHDRGYNSNSSKISDQYTKTKINQEENEELHMNTVLLLRANSKCNRIETVGSEPKVSFQTPVAPSKLQKVYQDQMENNSRKSCSSNPNTPHTPSPMDHFAFLNETPTTGPFSVTPESGITSELSDNATLQVPSSVICIVK